ncbi:mannose-6-phosphate isomerase, class I [[Clostridium] bifermentans ATCC 638]|uniref:mannose-6-phosphate isomerase n=1 Tax=Paraclostridium bifermentans ATCC 638 = DSM 14991 TaxID=1233171 RepID=T4VJP3_PARBF|nr:mannose-6-phosphate isomerase, class I [Paraclostridium bifermentans]EQK43939.1 mannose-6-phosphate isomerase, class I [[Clostridium] bifermentans ATCC 638] [Paraclostridium bifermentans ATCC 638 = DSM 14991]RIZ59370.1 mannose-6-phosphate isomerase, class I [Paraclostridium bifermentans]UAG17762.1 mannose-6-phosphate isomerase, class I [Paraclostridium bifermentans]
MEPLFLKPLFMHRIWGGTTLRDKFNYEIPSENTGECWAISSHENGDCEITNGKFKGMTLSILWSNHKELFGNMPGDKFPLLTKILDANDNLSVQVHPDNEYANKNENGELGKTECWYIIDCDDDAEMIFGHNAKSKEELEYMVSNNKWSDLLRRVRVNKGDFFYVPSGTIHALCKGTLVLETQQNSDTTYRVYDYDRIDSNGNKRDLHVDKSITVTTVPHIENKSNYKVLENDNFKLTTFVSNEFFSVHKLDVFNEYSSTQDNPFELYSVIDGDGKLVSNSNEYSLNKGDNFILPNNFGEFKLIGNLQLIISHM